MNPRLCILFLVYDVNNENVAMRKKLQTHLQIFFKIGGLRNFANFTGKHLFSSLFLIKLQIWRLANLLRRDSNTCALRKKLQKQSLQRRCFPLKFCKNFKDTFYRTPPVATFGTKRILQLPFYYILEQEISTGMRAMKERTKHMLQLPIYYILVNLQEAREIDCLCCREVSAMYIASGKTPEREESSPCRFYG